VVIGKFLNNKMRKQVRNIAVIGGGISGLSVANLLAENFNVKVFEKEAQPGGLIRCDRVNGHLYHKVGGHVFNSKRKDVLDRFWKFFDQNNEFIKADRNAVIALKVGQPIKYPIENHIYMLEDNTVKCIIRDMLGLSMRKTEEEPANFEAFLLSRFGETLYELYFKPYNHKIWKQNLKKIPLSWLEGKLPMPTPEEIMFNNFTRLDEKSMVHNFFYYPKHNGSQFLADRLAENINIEYNTHIRRIEKDDVSWRVNGESFDAVIYCGNIKELPCIIGGIDMVAYYSKIDAFDFHGTTSVLCEIENNNYSWIYLPDSSYDAHHIICTGNFARLNNAAPDIKTATLEFTDKMEKEEILHQIKKIPFTLNYVTHAYTKYTYPVQHTDTRTVVTALKKKLEKENFFLSGRFAEWEYYNMDAAMGAAIDTVQKFYDNVRFF
jgi:protoporphyrinogen oxidase